MKTVTLDMLIIKDACLEQRELFAIVFGNEIVISEEMLKQHLEFDYNWAAENLLTAPARKAYGEAMATARKAYGEAMTPTRKAYDEAMATADKAYDEAMTPARKAYDEVMAPARKAYDEAMAVMFARAFLAQEEL